MARLNYIVDSDDELPELSSILAESLVLDRKNERYRTGCNNKTNHSPNGAKTTLETLPIDKKETHKQRPFKIAHVNSLLLSVTSQRAPYPEKGVNPEDRSRSSPRKPAKEPQKQQSLIFRSSDASDSEDVWSDHMSDFIVSDSYSDSEEECQRSSSRRPPPSNLKHKRADRTTAPSLDLCSPRTEKGRCWRKSHRLPGEQSVNATESPAKNGKGLRSKNLGLNVGTVGPENGFEEPGSMLRFSPPRLKSPSRSPPVAQAVTPSTSPTRSKLVSPTRRPRIPPSPHRPSIDAFWSQEIINDWNDQHSPKKTRKSSHARKLYAPDKDDEDYLLPCGGLKSPSKSPTKPGKQAAQRRKAFNERKIELAVSFLGELDRTIADGQIAKLTESTGGVRFVWSKTLQSTAGRAKWRREAIRSKDADGTVSSTCYRHHASIELAEKVIDDEDRLVNVIAHEYCHLLNYMISNIKDSPHGKEFKAWARKCSTAFVHRGIHVTTKHSYKISYKYVWACSDCATEYKRHSKSIDPTRHACGKCKGKLLQIKPVPRGEGKGISEYQKFVKERFARVKKEKPEMSMGEIMTVLGKEFREKKEKQKLEMVVVEEKAVEVGVDCAIEDAGLDSVMRKLDSLDLATS
ncbi:MAG: hypothetical protein Q9218_001250 [Villophora microphyllina]